VAEGEQVEVAGVPVLGATLPPGGRRLRLYVVHTVAPLGPDRERWRRRLAWLARAVGRERDPVVVADLVLPREGASVGRPMAYHRGMDPFGLQRRRRCRCGHPRAAHEHYRRGTDCALCGPDACPRYRRSWSWRR
jgi:hypothetical protein